MLVRIIIFLQLCGLWPLAVDKVVLGQVFSDYFSFPCQSSFHLFLHNRHHPGLVQ
jgi:hypothetical protein